MTKGLSVFVLATSLTCVGASQLIVKGRLLPLAAALKPGQPWHDILLRLLSDPYLWLGAALAVIGGVCWYLALAKLPLNLMLPAASMIAPCASIAAYFLFGESLSTAKIAAILTIMAGVAWLGWLNS